MPDKMACEYHDYGPFHTLVKRATFMSKSVGVNHESFISQIRQMRYVKLKYLL